MEGYKHYNFLCTIDLLCQGYRSSDTLYTLPHMTIYYHICRWRSAGYNKACKRWRTCWIKSPSLNPWCWGREPKCWCLLWRPYHTAQMWSRLRLIYKGRQPSGQWSGRLRQLSLLLSNYSPQSSTHTQWFHKNTINKLSWYSD